MSIASRYYPYLEHAVQPLPVVMIHAIPRNMFSCVQSLTDDVASEEKVFDTEQVDLAGSLAEEAADCMTNIVGIEVLEVVLKMWNSLEVGMCACTKVTKTQANVMNAVDVGLHSLVEVQVLLAAGCEGTAMG